MLRLALEDDLQNGRAFKLIGVGLIGRQGRGVEGKRVVDLRLVVVWITLRELFHGLGIGLYARAVVDLVVIHVHDPERVQVVAFTLGLGPHILSLSKRRGTLGEIFRGRRYVRIPEEAQRNSPI